MILNEIPEIVKFEYEDGEVEATVLFISPKTVPALESIADDFVVVCYDEGKKIYEIHLTEVKIVKTRKYGSNFSTPQSINKKRRKKRKQNEGRIDNSTNKEDTSD